jgi:hypothetical protein
LISYEAWQLWLRTQHPADRLLGPRGAAITKRISSIVVGMNRGHTET